MPHIHVHLHDSGTSEGARKAAQTRKSGGGSHLPDVSHLGTPPVGTLHQMRIAAKHVPEAEKRWKAAGVKYQIHAPQTHSEMSGGPGRFGMRKLSPKEQASRSRRVTFGSLAHQQLALTSAKGLRPEALHQRPDGGHTWPGAHDWPTK